MTKKIVGFRTGLSPHVPADKLFKEFKNVQNIAAAVLASRLIPN